MNNQSIVRVPLRQLIVNLRNNGQVLIPFSPVNTTQVKINWTPKYLDSYACVYFSLEVTSNPGVWDNDNASGKRVSVTSKVATHNLGHVLKDLNISSGNLAKLAFEYGTYLRQELSDSMANAIETGSGLVVFDASSCIKEMYGETLEADN